MIEVPKNKSKSAVLETVVVAGLFMSAFYFLFFEEIDNVLKKYGVKGNGKSDNNNNNVSETPIIINPEQYEGRTEYCVDNNNPDSCVKGFTMPNRIDDLIFSDNGKITVITKADARPFGLPPKAMVRLFRSGDSLSYFGYVDGVKGTYNESYDDIKDEIVLTKNTYLKIN